MSGDLERGLVSSYQYMDGILKAMRGNEIIKGEGAGGDAESPRTEP